MRGDGVAEVMFYERILGTEALFRRPIPFNAWRLLLEYGAREPSFLYNIIPAFTNDGDVVLLVATGGGRDEKGKEREQDAFEEGPQSRG